MVATDAERFAETVAAQVRAEIAAAGTTVAGVARTTGINRETLDRWVKGERAMNLATLYRIAAAVGVPPHTIVERAEERFAKTAASHDVGRAPDYDVSPGGPDPALPLAADRGVRKSDQQ
ncbi:helix-turn-helix domain-containing protein [Protaetiibacter mangrovi]|uniref:Helix-turn-helix domain-containing protein n=1 Tax=Protaetiibacter mangrovi TaxID=2970926 RepID=A0ABT1ZIR4_9MICO|nr:helix-turn-helix domain-containing protein [Protaetiibacter mangrovi]MCS0500608.1 helix-turn-helix domain-containing protein [Protaetiibacter mangrovi]